MSQTPELHVHTSLPETYGSRGLQHQAMRIQRIPRLKRKSALLLWQLSLVLLLVPLLCESSHAQTLYQRSIAKLHDRAGKAAPDDYTFVVMGDSRNGEKKFKQALRLARSYDPLFILHGGDYSDKGGEEETARFLLVLNQSVPDIPLFVVIGNHENCKVFEKKVGPSNFTLSSKRLGFKLIALNNADDALRAPEQELLRRELASASGAVFVAMHVPPRTKRWPGHSFTRGADDLEKILAGSRVQALFLSHSHVYDRSEFGGVPAFITGGAGAPLPWFPSYGERVHHILVVRVKNGKASCRMVPLP